MAANSESTSILRRAKATRPGAVIADVVKRVETIFLSAANTPTVFGQPVKYDGSDPRCAEAIEANDAASVLAGFICLTVPSMAAGLENEDTFDVGTLNPQYAKGLLKAGAMGVKCTIGTPVRGNPVYMRVVEDGAKKVSDLEATSDMTATDAAMVGTGNATIGDVVATQDAEAGVYTVRMLTATTFNLHSPTNKIYGPGTLAAEFVAGGLTFTATAGATPAVAGDTIAITVTHKNVKLPTVVWHLDGKDEDDNAAIFVNGL